MSDPFLGPAVVNGRSRFYSVSALERADTRQCGCMRKWWYRYVARIKEAQTESKDAGIKLHDELAAYLRTGVPMLSALAMSGLHAVPDPGPDLLVEQPIHIIDSTGIRSMIGANNIPLIGKIDCGHRRGINKGGEDIEHTLDPKGTVEIIDWKWKKDGSKTEYYLEPGELVRSIQMSGYGLGLGRALGASHVRLSHVYFPLTRGKPRKVTKLHVLDDCARSWEYTEALARTIADVARETSPERVPANPHACDRFGGCPYRDAPVKCSGYRTQSLADLFGETAGKDITMGLIGTLPPAPGATIQPVAGQPAVDMRLQLAQEEQQQRVQATQQSVGVLPGFPEAWAAIERGGRGIPALGGAAAQMRAAIAGQQLAPGAGYAGTGDLGAIMFQDPAHVLQLGGEMYADEQRKAAAQVAQQQQVQNPLAQAQAMMQAPQSAPVQHVQHFQAPVSVLPPDAPASNPALAAKPLEPQPGIGAAVLQTTIAGTPMPPIQVYAPPSHGAQGVVQTTIAAAAKPKRGRKPKAAAAEQAAPVTGYPTPIDGSVPAMIVPPPSDELEVYVDAIPNCDFESLHPYVDQLLERLCTKFIPPDGLKDVRCAPKDGPLGFGGWRGAVRAIVMELPPPAARYYLDTRGNELASEVADAMRVVCERANALYVRGVR